MVRILIAALMVVASAAAYAQFNRCGEGLCPNALFADGLSVSGSSIPPPPCVPGASTGEMDFSVCSNAAITAAVF